MIQNSTQSSLSIRNSLISRCATFLSGALVVFLPVVCQAQTAPTYTISAAAGNGTAGFAGDGAAAASAQLNFPSSLALDSSGNLYIADQANFRIRKVDTSGNITTIAGTGTNGDTGDSKAATSADIGTAGGIAVDSSGNIYFSDTARHVIRKIASGGTITTFAGTGTLGYSGDTTPDLIAAGVTLVVATNATLNSPTGIAVDSKGNVYFSDTGNNRIRRVSVTDATVTTVAGDGNGNFYGENASSLYSEINHPTGMVFDAADNLYFADSLNHRIRKISAADGRITTVAGLGWAGNADHGGLATNSLLHYPNSVAVDSTGNLYISDFINNRVRMVDTSGLISTIAGSGRFGNGGDGGPATAASMYFPCWVTVDKSGKVYVIDSLNTRVRLLTSNAAPSSTPNGSTDTPTTPADRTGLPTRHVAAHSAVRN